MILPVGIVALKSSARTTVNPRSVSCFAASSYVAAPVTSGTATGAGPSLTSSCSVESRGACASHRPGSVPITASAGTDSSYWCFTFTTNPAPSSVAWAVVG